VLFPSLLRTSFIPAAFSAVPRVGFEMKAATVLLSRIRVLSAFTSVSTWESALLLPLLAAEKRAPAYFPARPGGVTGSWDENERREGEYKEVWNVIASSQRTAHSLPGWLSPQGQGRRPSPMLSLLQSHNLGQPGGRTTLLVVVLWVLLGVMQSLESVEIWVD
jgi:hypothetical protein